MCRLPNARHVFRESFLQIGQEWAGPICVINFANLPFFADSFFNFLSHARACMFLHPQAYLLRFSFFCPAPAQMCFLWVDLGGLKPSV